jgi:transposase InsO family protein
MLYIDNGTEFTDLSTQKTLAKHGVIHKTIPPHTSEYNEIIKKCFHLIFQTARTLLHQSRLAPKFWTEAVRLATYLTNHLPTKKLDCSPYEAWTEHPPDISNIHIFGSKGQVLVEGKHLLKFDKHIVKMTYLEPAISNHDHHM